MINLQKFLDDAYEIGIRNPDKWLQGRCFNWGFLRGAFPRGCVPSDCDGEIEINGHFLRFEMKYVDAVRKQRMGIGQERHLKALVKTGFFTVFVVGHDDKMECKCVRIWHQTPQGFTEKYKRECDNQEVFELSKNWSDYAEKIMP